MAAIPTMAPMTQPQEILPTAAAIASPITIRTAIGVAIVSVKSTSESAPVSKGESWASVREGRQPRAASVKYRRAVQPRQQVERTWIPPRRNGGMTPLKSEGNKAEFRGKRRGYPTELQFDRDTHCDCAPSGCRTSSALRLVPECGASKTRTFERAGTMGISRLAIRPNELLPSATYTSAK